MFLKRILPVSLIFLAGVFAFCNFAETSCIGGVDATYQNGWQNVYQVRVERRNETCGIIPGAFYTFSTRRADSENWRELMTHRFDDPIDIPDKSVRIVSEKVAVVYMGWKTAITSDGGKTWNLWNGETDPENWKAAGNGSIDKINVSENGTGEMIFHAAGSRTEPKAFYTSDFGKTWKQTK